MDYLFTPSYFIFYIFLCLHSNLCYCGASINTEANVLGKNNLESIPPAIPQQAVLTNTRKPTSVPTKSYRPTYAPSTTKSRVPTTKTIIPSKSPNLRVFPSSSPALSRPTIVPTTGSPSKIRTHSPNLLTSISALAFNTSTVDFDLASNSSKQLNSSFVGYSSQFPTTHNISYFNGSVMSGTINLYHIFVGKFESSTMTILRDFASNIGSSAWFSILPTSYYGLRNGNRFQAANNTKFIKATSYLPTQTSGELTSALVVQAVSSLIGNSSVDPNGIYTVFFNGGFSADGWNSPGPSNWCGYHLFKSGIRISVIGNPAPLNAGGNKGCIPPQFSVNNAGFQGSPNGDIGADSMLSTYAHEIAETVTNFDGNGWHSARETDIEIADFCNRQFGNKNFNLIVRNKRYLIQSLWQPGFGCVMAPQTLMPSMSPSVVNSSIPSPLVHTSAPSNILPTKSPTTLLPSVATSSAPPSILSTAIPSTVSPTRSVSSPPPSPRPTTLSTSFQPSSSRSSRPSSTPAMGPLVPTTRPRTSESSPTHVPSMSPFCSRLPRRQKSRHPNSAAPFSTIPISKVDDDYRKGDDGDDS